MNRPRRISKRQRERIARATAAWDAWRVGQPLPRLVSLMVLKAHTLNAVVTCVRDLQRRVARLETKARKARRSA